MIITPGNTVAFSSVSGTTVVSGVPTQRFRKEIIKTGRFVKDADGVEFLVSRDMLSHWVTQFIKMKEAGVKVPIPNKHVNEGDADQNRGYVHDMFVDGDSLIMVCDMIGEDAIQAAARSDVSIKSPLKFVDGSGNEYERPIVHVALCTDPVVPGLSEFVPIAASRRSQKMDFNKIAKVLGIEEKMTSNNAEELILSVFEDVGGRVIDLEASLKDLADKQEKEDDEKDDKEKVKPNPMIVKTLAENRTLKLSQLVETGKITPAARKRLAAQFIGKEDSAITLALSRDGNDGFDEVIAALKENASIKTGERTGVQLEEGNGDLVELQRGSDGKPRNFLMEDAERRVKEARETVNV